MLKSLTQLVLILNKAGEFLKLANALHMSLSQFVAHMVGAPNAGTVAAPVGPPSLLPSAVPTAPVVSPPVLPVPTTGNVSPPSSPETAPLSWGPTIPADNE